MQSGIGSLVCSETRHHRHSIFWGLAPWRCPLTTAFAAAVSIRRRQASSKQGLKALKSQKKERKKEAPSLMDGSFYFGKDDVVIRRNPNIIQSIVCWSAWSCLIQQTFKAKKTHAKTWTLYMVSITAPPWHSMGKKMMTVKFKPPTQAALWETEPCLQLTAPDFRWDISALQHVQNPAYYPHQKVLILLGVSYSMGRLTKKIIMIKY